MSMMSKLLLLALLPTALLAACNRPSDPEAIAESSAELSTTPAGSYNLHLEATLRFNAVQPGADANHGRQLFGLAADLNTPDATLALFQGPSQAFGGTVVSNGRSCFTCHRGTSAQQGLPKAPLSATIPLSDPLFTGIDGDAQGDPDAFANLDQRALVKYRPNRFNLARDESDPYRKVFFWRKSIKLVNTGFGHGFLNDARARVMFETDRGAVFSHTQSSDSRFDDLFTLQNGADMEAFQFTQTLSDPRLAALRDPSDPMFSTLASNPFYTVAMTTDAQKRGKNVFKSQCMDCHNTPNVFGNVWNVEPTGNGERPQNSPNFAPSVGRTFNIGVSERNKHGLRFTHFDGPAQFSDIIIPLVNEDGTVKNHKVTTDIGLAGTTGRTADIGRFKVPQLRSLQSLAPYFHDNSADTLEEVVDYFNSDQYNHSKDGKDHPVHLNAQQRADLLEFLKIL